MNNQALQPYRIKHIPSGLYYKPGNTNLSTRGKIYTTGCSVLSLYKDCDTICISISKTSAKVYNILKDMVQFRNAIKSVSLVVADIPKSDFEIEYFTT